LISRVRLTQMPPPRKNTKGPQLSISGYVIMRGSMGLLEQNPPRLGTGYIKEKRGPRQNVKSIGKYMGLLVGNLCGFRGKGKVFVKFQLDANSNRVENIK